MKPFQQKSIGREKAIELAASHWWEVCDDPREIAEFQFGTKELCCPFEVFHEALEKTLGRPIFTHELALNADGIAAELLGEREAPTIEEIISLIPANKRIIIPINGDDLFT